jgi:sterol desaturase/sphingolipid hydroxylase (fatty acid hydroxylase superfamily)
VELAKNTFLLYLSTPLYAILIGLEMLLSNAHKRNLYTLKDTLANFYLMLLNFGLDVLMLLLVTTPTLDFFYRHRFFEISDAWVYWLILLVFQDLLFYLLHYVDHHSRLFWAVHSTHHSSDNYNLTTGFRSSVFQPLYRFVYFIPLALCGFKALDIMFMYSATQIYGILIHTQYVGKLGFLEYIFATPSNHRVHHASNVKYLDKNMGMVFIIWDRLFGTFQEEESEEQYEEMKYGLTKKAEKINAYTLVMHEWQLLKKDLQRKIPFRTKVKYILMPPGWSHDNSSLTSKQLQEELNKEKQG